MANKTSARALVAHERASKAVDLRKAGANYEAIGKVLGVSAQAAHKMVKKYLEKVEAHTIESAAEAKRLELERLDAMLMAIWPKVKAGDIRAVGEARARGAERRKVLGLDAPEKSEVSGPNGTALGGATFVLPMPMGAAEWSELAQQQSKGTLAAPENGQKS